MFGKEVELVVIFRVESAKEEVLFFLSGFFDCV